MLLVAVGTFVMLLVVIYLIAAPLARGEPSDAASDTASLLLRKERLLADIRDLDMDLVTGKLDEDDHRRLRAALMVDAAHTLKALEETGVAAPRDGSPTARESAATDEDAWVEDLIAARKGAILSSACPSCGAVADPEDAFCRRCGAALAFGRGTA